MNKRSLFIITSLVFIGALTANASIYRGRANGLWNTLKSNFKDVSETTVIKKRIVDEESAVIEVVEKASPAVVSILRRQVLFDFFSGREVVDESGIGTGFVVDSKGVVITNKHVVSDSSASYSILMSNDETYPIEEIFSDPANDIAILKIGAENLPMLSLGDSDKMKVGQTVVAIGNALGRFSNTVTKGVVSGIGRGIAASGALGGQTEMLENIIQTDAAINPGNSGGPLLDLDGLVVGVNVAMAQGAENIGFSIPINVIKPVLQNFAVHGKIVRPYLGVRYRPAYKRADDSRLEMVFFIEQVMKGSPADEAGIEVGDVIFEIDGVKVSEKVDLAVMIARKQVGDKIRLVIDRGGKRITIEAELEESE
jgi:serine protease Do